MKKLIALFTAFLIMAVAFSPHYVDAKETKKTETVTPANQVTTPAVGEIEQQNPEGTTPDSQVGLQESNQSVSKEGEEFHDFPAKGSTVIEIILWIFGIFGASNIVRFIFRFLPTTVNTDWIGTIVYWINILLGAWMPNQKLGGGTFVRKYSPSANSENK